MTRNDAASQRLSQGILSAIALAGALGLIGVSLTFNAMAGLARADDPFGQTAWVAASLGADMIKIVAPLAFIAALSSQRYIAAAICAALAVVTILYSLSGAIAFSHGSMADAAAVRQHSNGALHSARQEVGEIEAEIEALGSVQPVARIAAEIGIALQAIDVTIQRKTRDCSDATAAASRAACAPVVAMRVEHDKAVAAEALRARLQGAREKVASLPPEKVADPAAEGASHMLKALGFAVKPDALSPWLALLSVALVEVGSAFGLCLVSALRPASAPRSATAEPIRFEADEPVVSVTFEHVLAKESEPPAAIVPSANTEPVATPEPSAEAHPAASATEREERPEGRNGSDRAKQRRGNRKPASRQSLDDLKRRMISQIMQAGGSLETSDRQLASSIDAPLGTAHKARKLLEAEGRIECASSKSGTTLALVA